MFSRSLKQKFNPIQTEQAFQDLNVIFCELTSLQILSLSEVPHPPTNPRSSRVLNATSGPPSELRVMRSIAPQVERVGEYVIQLLAGNLGVVGNTQTSLPRPISPSAYNAILPTVWAILNRSASGRSESSDALLDALVDHAIKTSSTSQVKKHTIDVLGRLLLVSR